MSEKLPTSDIMEILNPQNTPEMGFESYKMLGGKKETREQLRGDFFKGIIRNPGLDYPRLNEAELDLGIRSLWHVMAMSEGLEDEIKDTAWNSAAYRAADMYWLKSLIYLQEVAQRGTETQIQVAAKQHQELNEELFGVPSQEQTEAIIGEVFTQTSEKQLTPSNQQLYEDLLHGFKVDIDSTDTVTVPPLAIGFRERLPTLSEDGIEKVGEIIKEDFPFILDIVNDYYETVINAKPEEERAFAAKDMFEIFNLIKSVDTSPISQAKIIMDPDVAPMSWDTERGAVIVGGRHEPVVDKNKMIGKIFHEYAVHAGRSLKGAQSEFPTLGTGIFTEPDAKNNADYLTFEEGFAYICEMAIKGGQQKWIPKDFEKTLAISLAYKGYDFRQVYETLIRLRVLMLSKNGEDLPDKSQAKAQRDTYRNVERIFRGTPADLARINPDGSLRVLTYNKDLAYLNGAIKAIKFIESADEAAIRRAFRGKYDPTNPKQLALAEKYLS